MNCGKFEIRLTEWLDGQQLELDEQAAAHARKCPQCGELLAAHELLFAGLHAMPLPEPSGDFSLRVVTDVVEGRRRAWSRVGWALPMAAGLLAAITLWQALPSSSSNVQVANRSNVAPAVVVAEKTSAAPGYLTLLRQSGLAHWSGLGPGREGSADFAPPAWVGKVADGLRPLPTSMGAVLMAQPMTSPMGAALMALNRPVPGA